MTWLKLTLTTITLVTSFSAFAESAIERTNCKWIRDARSCTSHLECFWDADDNRCEQRGFNDLCGLAPSRDICFLFNDTCFWDASDNRCEMRQ